jgi:cobalt-zinc-cadmium efflux system outer membrane protein
MMFRFQLVAVRNLREMAMIIHSAVEMPKHDGEYTSKLIPAPMNRVMLVAVLFLISHLFAAQPAVAAEMKSAESLPQMIDTALADNPELKASEARWETFRNKIVQARSFDDPMLTLAIRNGVLTAPLNFGKEPMTGKVVGLSQKIPFWGKRDLQGEIAAKTAESYHWTVEERKVELRRMVKESWYQIYYIDKSLEIVDKNIKILDDFITLAETKYSVNQGTQTDVFKAQVERSKLLDMRITLTQQRISAQANLNTLLYRPADTRVGKIPDFDIQPVSLSGKELRETAYVNRPEVKVLAARIGKGEAGLKLADKEFYPDFNVFAEYMQRDPIMGNDGSDMYSIGVSFNLPVQRARRHAVVAESDSEIRMAREELNSLKNSIDFGVSDMLAKLEKRKNLAELYKTGIIPQADQALESATINYRVNKVDFLTLLNSQMVLFNYEREYYDSLADYQVKKAELEALVGKELK